MYMTDKNGTNGEGNIKILLHLFLVFVNCVYLDEN